MTDRIDDPSGPGRTEGPGRPGTDRDLQPGGEESRPGRDRSREGQPGAPRQPQPDRPDVAAQGSSRIPSGDR